MKLLKQIQALDDKALESLGVTRKDVEQLKDIGFDDPSDRSKRREVKKKVESLPRAK